MVFFPNTEIELWKLQTTTNYEDIYGDTQINYTLHDTIPADIQELNNKDMQEEFGKILQDTYKMYLDKNVDIEDTMILRIKDTDKTFKIIGSPNLNNHLPQISHIKMYIQLQRKPTKLEG